MWRPSASGFASDESSGDPELTGLVGRYLFADLCEAWVRTVPASEVNGSAEELQVDLEGEHPLSFGANNAGEIYLSTFEGSAFRLEAAGRLPGESR